MFLRRNQRFSLISFVTLLLSCAAIGNFAYLVSPLRNPNFEPNSANAGSLVPWLQQMTEGDWAMVATVLAILLSTNLTIIFYQFSANALPQGGRLALRITPQKTSHQHPATKIRYIMLFAVCLGMWLLSTATFWVAFMVYLMNQWLID